MCVRSARTDLCGGCRVTGIPTAIRSPSPDPCRPRPETGARSTATSVTPSASSLTDRVTMALPGKTEAGSAGKQPCRGIARRAHRDDDHGRGSHLSRSSQSPIGSIDPDALKIPARRAPSTLTRSAHSPVPAEPGHNKVGLFGKLRAIEAVDDELTDDGIGKEFVQVFSGFATAIVFGVRIEKHEH